ncbi:MAG: hypothetical protein IJR85_02175 [Synergistaceae bacterium]|nr:hypothetical protein [Synergistaceae bacterium]
MMKRIFLLVVAVVLVLSLNVSAWAASYAIDEIKLNYTTLYNVENESGKPLKIKIRTYIFSSSQSNNKLMSANAAVLQLEAEADDDVVTDLALSSSTGNNTNNTPRNRVRFDLDVDVASYDVELTGKIAGPGTITVTAKLLTSAFDPAETENSDSEILEQTAEIELSEEEGYDEHDDDEFGPEIAKVAVHDSRPILDGGPADPASTNANWDGVVLPVGSGDQGDSKNKPKIATSSLTFYPSKAKVLTAGVSTDFTIEIDGPTPKVDVYITYKNAKKLWPLSKDTFTSNISLTQQNILKYKLPFRVKSCNFDTSANQDKTAKHYITIAYNGAYVSYKGFPLTISAENGGTKGKKAVTKTYKIDIVSPNSLPQWTASDGTIIGNKVTENIVARLSYSRKIPNTTYTVSCDSAYTITAKPQTKDGVAVNVYQSVLNKYGEVMTPGYVVIGGEFEAAKVTDKSGNLKEDKVTVSLVAASSKKSTLKTVVIGKVSPYFDPKKTMPLEDADEDAPEYLTGIKRVEAGKVPSVKFAAKGSKTITYSISEEDLEALNAVNLSFDCVKGTIVALKNARTKKALPTLPTQSGGDFESLDIAVKATNGTGKTATVRALIGITGAKPTLANSSKTITIPYDTEDEEFALSCEIAKKAVTEEDEDNNIKYSVDDANAKALEALGLELADGERNKGVIRIIDKDTLKATKGTKIKLLLENLGAYNTGTVTVVITDPAPEIEIDGDSDLALYASAKGSVTGTTKLKVTDETKPTSDNPKLSWSVKLNPTSKGITAKVSSSGKYGAELKITAKSKYTDDYSGIATVTVINKENGLKGELPIDVSVSGAVLDSAFSSKTGNYTASYETAEQTVDALADTGSEGLTESLLTFGAPRTASDLTEGQKAFIESKGYTVIAVLPEITANTDGQQDIAVVLDENSPEGAKLVWLAFPQNSEETDDDRIADFYDETGAEIEAVPAEKNITAAPWLRAGVIYQPVIAAEEK